MSSLSPEVIFKVHVQMSNSSVLWQFSDGCKEMFIMLPSCHRRDQPCIIRWWGRVSVKNWSLGILNLNPSHSPHPALSLTTGSQWTHIKWQANIFPPVSFWVLVRERHGLHRLPHSCWIQMWGRVAHFFKISQSSPHSLAAGTHHVCLAVTNVTASERALIMLNLKLLEIPLLSQVHKYWITASLWDGWITSSVSLTDLCWKPTFTNYIHQ